METRETMLSGICSDDHRVQYDGKDDPRIADIASGFTQAAVSMIESLGKYRDAMGAELNEDSADSMKEARYDVIYAFAMAQAAVSKVAWGLRIDADEAYKRALETATDDMPDLSDL